MTGGVDSTRVMGDDRPAVTTHVKTELVVLGLGCSLGISAARSDPVLMRYARFNPPWTLWFARRNEVALLIGE